MLFFYSPDQLQVAESSIELPLHLFCQPIFPEKTATYKVTQCASSNRLVKFKQPLVEYIVVLDCTSMHIHVYVCKSIDYECKTQFVITRNRFKTVLWYSRWEANTNLGGGGGGRGEWE